MDDVRHIVVMGRAARNNAAIKNRQPLSRILVVAPVQLPADYNDLIADELNVKQVEYLADNAALLDYTFKPQLRTLGKRLGKLVSHVGGVLAELPGRETMAHLKANGHIVINIDGQEIHLAEEDLLIETVQPEGLFTESDRDFTVALDTRLTPELIEEGFVRELISKIQTMRKDSGFEVSDRIVVRHSGNETLAGVIARNQAFIAEEVLADAIETGPAETAKSWDINGQKINLAVSLTSR